ncbi:MAG: hypothetical protein Q7U38_19535 [Methylobacter sp.]|nr:hypothetical protein [Methylobacter sp.]MDP2099654.1 hypothetical protein [Methylobacter sp.]MDP2426507.1 hypothetical protein [Methylobacter sp.]MDP3361599.1 hypothetical protein [Methylobacter sp.]
MKKDQKAQFIKILEALSQNTGTKSASTIIQALHDQIEISLTSGVKRKIILDAINQEFNRSITLENFDKTLYRIRRDIKKNNINPISTITNNSSNMVPYYNNKTNCPVATPAVNNLVEIESEDDRKDEPQTSELEFRENVKKQPDIQAINKFCQEYKEKKRLEKIQEKEQKMII